LTLQLGLTPLAHLSVDGIWPSGLLAFAGLPAVVLPPAALLSRNLDYLGRRPGRRQIGWSAVRARPLVAPSPGRISGRVLREGWRCGRPRASEERVVCRGRFACGTPAPVAEIGGKPGAFADRMGRR
jgi:hypothetical protein